jgi:hypothetical protein
MNERVRLLGIRRAHAGTTRSSLDLLTLRYPFSQVNLLAPEEFVREAERRQSSSMSSRLHLDVAALEALHRHGVLVPLFRVDLTTGDAQRHIDVTGSLTAQHVTTTIPSELFRSADDGRVYDPAEEPFAAGSTVDSGYLYSRHQLLALDIAEFFVEQLVPERQADESIAWHLDDADLPTDLQRESLRSWRSLAITLSALDTYYWPQVTHLVTHDVTIWREAWVAFEAATMLSWLGISLDDIINQATDRGGGEVAVAGDEVDDAHAGQLPVGAGDRLRMHAELGGELRPWGELAMRACLAAVHRVGDGVGGLDPSAGVVPAGSDGHHVRLAQTIRPPSPVTSAPQAPGPVSAATMLSPREYSSWSSVRLRPRHGPPASRHSIRRQSRCTSIRIVKCPPRDRLCTMELVAISDAMSTVLAAAGQSPRCSATS